MSRQILLVDDDHDDATLFEEVCEGIDSITFRHAFDGQEALNLLQENQVAPEMLFLDINMPVLNGWQSLQALRKDPRWKDLPVIMYSTSSHQREIELAKELGASAFLTKPDSYKELQRLIRLFVTTPHTRWHHIPDGTTNGVIVFNGSAS